MNTDAEIYLRILADMHFMSEIIRININEADSFCGKMLRERYAIERETVRLDEERQQREYEARRIQENANQVELKERNTDD